MDPLNALSDAILLILLYLMLRRSQQQRGRGVKPKKPTGPPQGPPPTHTPTGRRYSQGSGARPSTPTEPPKGGTPKPPPTSPADRFRGPREEYSTEFSRSFAGPTSPDRPEARGYNPMPDGKIFPDDPPPAPPEPPADRLEPPE